MFPSFNKVNEKQIILRVHVKKTEISNKINTKLKLTIYVDNVSQKCNASNYVHIEHKTNNK